MVSNRRGACASSRTADGPTPARAGSPLADNTRHSPTECIIDLALQITLTAHSPHLALTPRTSLVASRRPNKSPATPQVKTWPPFRPFRPPGGVTPRGAVVVGPGGGGGRYIGDPGGRGSARSPNRLRSSINRRPSRRSRAGPRNPRAPRRPRARTTTSGRASTTNPLVGQPSCTGPRFWQLSLRTPSRLRGRVRPGKMIPRVLLLLATADAFGYFKSPEASGPGAVEAPAAPPLDEAPLDDSPCPVDMAARRSREDCPTAAPTAAPK